MQIERVVFTKLVPINRDERLHEFATEDGWEVREPEAGRVELVHRRRDIAIIAEGHEYVLHLVPRELVSAAADGATGDDTPRGEPGEGASASPPTTSEGVATGRRTGTAPANGPVVGGSNPSPPASTVAATAGEREDSEEPPQPFVVLDEEASVSPSPTPPSKPAEGSQGGSRRDKKHRR